MLNKDLLMMAETNLWTAKFLFLGDSYVSLALRYEGSESIIWEGNPSLDVIALKIPPTPMTYLILTWSVGACEVNVENGVFTDASLRKMTICISANNTYLEATFRA
nr:MAG TPA: hypothetical protein [Caudoviricetes sp.]